jgi:hypothetical protein
MARARILLADDHKEIREKVCINSIRSSKLLAQSKMVTP